MLKLHKLFFGENLPEVFSSQLEPTKDERDYLVQCKNDIRDHLRKGIREATVTVLGMERAVDPRFRTQGSWSYKTCVRPAHHPPQEMDWDFGVYLPVKVWEDNGPPRAMAKLYFDLVEALMQGLCKQRGWELVPGKNTCIRVKVAAWAHIDLPLYAAPENKFFQILEKAALSMEARRDAHDSAYLAESADFGEMPEQAWSDMDSIMMATRTGEWRSSDPEAVARWFNDRVIEHGPQLSRVCRYLKAWRDFHWKDGGGPSSVCLMIAASQNFTPQKGRDDLALENTAEHLATALQHNIREVAIDGGSDNFNRLNEMERFDASSKVKEFANALRQSRSWHLGFKEQAISTLQHYLGNRIPTNLELIEIDGAPEIIRNTSPRQVPRPVVPATKAG